MLWLLADLAAACSGPGSDVRLLATPREGVGLWIEVVSASLDFTLEVDGVEVSGDVREVRDPIGFGSTFALFAPDEPLVEGQSWRFTALPWMDEPVVREGLVGPAGAPEPPALVGVDIGEPIDGGGGSCLSSGWYRFVDLSVSDGEGLVLLDDEATGDRVRAVFTAGEPVETFFLREGRSDRGACLDSMVLLADGSETPGETVCSAGWGCASLGPPVASPLLAILLLRRRRSPAR